MQDLIDFESKANVMQPIFFNKLGLYISKTDIRAQKIDSFCLEIFNMVIAIFKFEDMIERF